MDYKQKSLELHAKLKGKIEVISKVNIKNNDDLATAYTPGVAQPCIEIKNNPELSYTYTRKGNLVAVITDGSAVLGLGNIGGQAGMPVMEGKCILFKEFADIDAFPICLSTQNTDEIVQTIVNIADSFGGINLEDISAPRCFEVEQKLKDKLNIPVFHDDQHGTAIVVLAGVMNALKLVHKRIDEVKVCISGAGAAGHAIGKLLLSSGVKELIYNDINGIIYEGQDGLDFAKVELSKLTNKHKIKGGLAEAVKGADVFIGVSKGGLLTADMVKTMNHDSIIFAMANPVPEIYPEEAKKAGARVVGSGRSDFPNQVNNILAFPGIFKGALSCRACKISDGMKLAASNALASLVSDDELSDEYVLPNPLDKRVVETVATAVRNQAIKEKLNKI